MITLRKAGTRGHALHGWLESWHSFSFADHHDPAHVRFGALRVINKDIVQPGADFDTHGHRDSMNNGEDIHSGEIQLMRAGSLQANGYELSAGDALMYVGEERVSLAAGSDAEVLLFDLM